MAAYAKWRHEHGIIYCEDCGERIVRSMHHFKCTKCWNETRRKKYEIKTMRGRCKWLEHLNMLKRS